MPFTNRGDELLSVLRARLLTVTGLPATRLWQNQRGDPSPTADSVEDQFVTFDTTRREVGPDAWKRTEALYRVALRVPTGTDAFAALALAVAVVDAFMASALTVAGNPVLITNTRTGPVLDQPQWLFVPVYLSLTFDHA